LKLAISLFFGFLGDAARLLKVILWCRCGRWCR